MPPIIITTFIVPYLLFLSFDLSQEDFTARNDGSGSGSSGSGDSGSDAGDSSNGGGGSGVKKAVQTLSLSSPSSGSPLPSTLPRQGGFDRVHGIRGYLTHSWIQCAPPVLSQRAVKAVTGNTPVVVII